MVGLDNSSTSQVLNMLVNGGDNCSELIRVFGNKNEQTLNTARTNKLCRLRSILSSQYYYLYLE
jgi:hypothetical protein